jgi:predicted ATPase with chaperone activity
MSTDKPKLGVLANRFVTNRPPARPPGGGGSQPGTNPPVVAEPQSIAESGLSASLITDLVLKIIYNGGQVSGNDIFRQVKLPFKAVVEPTLDFLKREEMVSVIGARGVGERGYQYALAGKGVERVREALDRNQYVGAAPVPLTRWTEQVKLQSVSGQTVHADDVRAALADLIIAPEIFRKIGPAVNSGRSLFLFGPPGNGKTVIARAIARMQKGYVYIPHAIEVDGNIIRMYDRLNHEAVDVPANEPGAPALDERWVLCRRPVLVVGGELTLNNLDLIYDPHSKHYEAPFQMKAINGMFLIDDFGRQQTRPQDLLNRWIVPLETRIDYLTLHTGKKIEIPFDELIAFSTNLDPKALVDEAFLRRIRHKIEIKNPSDAEYYQIFQRMAEIRKVPFDQQVFIYLMQEWYIKQQRALRAVHPRDLLDQIIDIANYEGVKPAMTKDTIDQACASYFVEL